MKKTLFLIFLVISLSVCPVLALEESGIGLSLKDFIQPMFSLFFVIIMIYCAFFAYSKLNKYNMQKFSNVSQKALELSKLSLISHLPLGQNKSVDVVKIHSKYLVLGVSGDNITLIKEFDGDNANITTTDSFEFDDEIPQNDKVVNFKNPKINELYKKYLKGSNDVQS